MTFFGSILSALNCLRRNGGNPLTALLALNNGDAVLGVVRWYLDRAASECGMAHCEYRQHDGKLARFANSALETAQANGHYARILDVACEMAERESANARQEIPDDAPSAVRACWISAAPDRAIKASHWRARQGRRAA